ncbi:prolyl oligopeptidase family serine peptidase [Catenulispora rubra]|uniref:prolyl oligopeptidase family serine peptidase n=1 Tax=Catenulispora rubra TaxID=280293 RepID=UPI001E43CB07|nr:prolyl oligopeptidase family serine peptidase [Catenulispora rubra]
MPDMPDIPEPHWHAYFPHQRLVKVRRGRGLRDVSLLVTDDTDGLALAVWDAETDEVTPIPADLADAGDGLEAVLGRDGLSLLAMRDDHGSEVGHVWRTDLATGAAVDLTPGLPPYVLRGLDVARTGGRVALTVVTDDGFELHVAAEGDVPRRLYASANEAWNGVISADGLFASVDTTDHNPGIRRFAVTVLAVEGAKTVSVLSDGPDAPVRAVRFSPVLGDNRLLVSTERSGFARPCVFNPANGARIDVDAPDLAGDLVALDWSDDAERLLLVHVDAGVHRVLEYDLPTATLRAVPHPEGAFFSPDVAAAHLNLFASHYGPGHGIRLLHTRFNQPLRLLRLNGDETREQTWDLSAAPTPVPAGTPLHSATVTSADGTPVQVWSARPEGATGPGPLVLSVHGGPNMVTVDGYVPEAQAFLAEGIGYAALNYRGSVTFGRDFREGFRPDIGDRETEDIAAAVNWLVEQDIADPTRIFITGHSYGGFLSLLSLGRLPALFAGALAFVALADWTTAYRDMNPAIQAAWRAFIGGSLEEVPDRYRRASPITYIDQVRAPAWIRQGRYDTRTPPAQAYGYARALEATGGDVVLDWFPGGHEITGRAHAIADHERTLTLIRAALAGQKWATGPVEP